MSGGKYRMERIVAALKAPDEAKKIHEMLGGEKSVLALVAMMAAFKHGIHIIEAQIALYSEEGAAEEFWKISDEIAELLDKSVQEMSMKVEREEERGEGGVQHDRG